jgi:hypothetical protein
MVQLPANERLDVKGSCDWLNLLKRKKNLNTWSVFLSEGFGFQSNQDDIESTDTILDTLTTCVYKY